LSLQVRLLLERENSDQAEPALIDFGNTEDNPAIEVKVAAGGDPSRHRFRRGPVYSERHRNGQIIRVYECACGCGELGGDND
jgi:hypothetical protein